MESVTDAITDHRPTTETLLLAVCLVIGAVLGFAMTYATGSRPIQFGVFVGIGLFVPRLLTGRVRYPA